MTCLDSKLLQRFLILTIKKREPKQRWTNFLCGIHLQTLTKLLQGFGRSIRSEDDWAKTYVLDTAVNNVFFKAQSNDSKSIL